MLDVCVGTGQGRYIPSSAQPSAIVAPQVSIGPPPVDRRWTPQPGRGCTLVRRQTHAGRQVRLPIRVRKSMGQRISGTRPSKPNVAPSHLHAKGFQREFRNMTKSLTRTTARIYGALTALGDGSTDLLERLLPFFGPILRPLQGTVLDLEDFAKEVRNTYKWNFNTDVVEVFIPRLRDAGWLTAVEPSVEQTSYTISLPDQRLRRHPSLSHCT